MKMRAVAIGTFDGVHRGHAAILKSIARIAKLRGLEPAALTFTVPPRLHFNPNQGPCLLTDPAEKKFLLSRLGIRKVVELKFGDRIARLSPSEFFDKVMVRDLRAAAVWVGYNFRFGAGRKGNVEVLKDLGKRSGILVQVQAEVTRRGRPVSSGRIREYLMKGMLDRAQDLLGHPYVLIGKVVRGNGRGRRLGFPTANVKAHPLKISPRGVFAVRVFLGSRCYRGMLNVGYRPTFDRGGAQTVEVHLLGYSGNLYGKTLRIEFVRKLRGERKFRSAAALAKQLEKDRRSALYIPLHN